MVSCGAVTPCPPAPTHLRPFAPCRIVSCRCRQQRRGMGVRVRRPRTDRRVTVHDRPLPLPKKKKAVPHRSQSAGGTPGFAGPVGDIKILSILVCAA